jgi:hypothetical protein
LKRSITLTTFFIEGCLTTTTPRLACSGRFDWYRDTEFRAPHVSVLLEELDRVMPKAARPEQVAFMQKLKQIAARCASIARLYAEILGRLDELSRANRSEPWAGSESFSMRSRTSATRTREPGPDHV